MSSAGRQEGLKRAFMEDDRVTLFYPDWYRVQRTAPNFRPVVPRTPIPTGAVGTSELEFPIRGLGHHCGQLWLNFQVVTGFFTSITTAQEWQIHTAYTDPYACLNISDLTSNVQQLVENFAYRAIEYVAIDQDANRKQFIPGDQFFLEWLLCSSEDEYLQEQRRANGNQDPVIRFSDLLDLTPGLLATNGTSAAYTGDGSQEEFNILRLAYAYNAINRSRYQTALGAQLMNNASIFVNADHGNPAGTLFTVPVTFNCWVKIPWWGGYSPEQYFPTGLLASNSTLDLKVKFNTPDKLVKFDMVPAGQPNNLATLLTIQNPQLYAQYYDSPDSVFEAQKREVQLNTMSWPMPDFHVKTYQGMASSNRYTLQLDTWRTVMQTMVIWIRDAKQVTGEYTTVHSVAVPGTPVAGPLFYRHYDLDLLVCADGGTTPSFDRPFVPQLVSAALYANSQRIGSTQDYTRDYMLNAYRSVFWQDNKIRKSRDDPRFGSGWNCYAITNALNATQRAKHSGCINTGAVTNLELQLNFANQMPASLRIDIFSFDHNVMTLDQQGFLHKQLEL